MANRYHWAGLIFFSAILAYPEIGVGARNGIRMWRDSKGILNISNVIYPINRAPQAKVAQPKNLGSETKTTAAPLPASLKQAFSSIYTYTDKTGVKHFTNIPVSGQNYELLLNTNFTRPALLQPRLTSNHLLATRKSIYNNIVAEAAEAYQVDQALVNAMIHAESAFNPTAVSPKGATGLMQLMPNTAQRYGVHDAFNPTENVHGGVRYLRDLLAMFNNDLSLAIAAYNAGENAVSRYGGIPPYAETTDYVQRVLALHNRYRNQMTP